MSSPQPTIDELDRFGAETEGYAVTVNFNGVEVLDTYKGAALPKPLFGVTDYCDDLSAAWRVAEKLGALIPYGVTFNPLMASYEAVLGSSLDALYEGYGHTPAEALMRACWKAKHGRTE